MIDPKLLEFCRTHAQRENIEAIIKHGSAQKAARALGKNRRSVDMALVRVKEHAARQGYSPEHDMTHLVPDGYLVKGVSTYYNGDGKPTAQWVKSSIDQSRAQQAFEAAIENACANIKPFKRVPAPKKTAADLLTNYVITDFHLGMYAWHLETGADWDMDIAESVMLNAISDMMDNSPDSEVGIFSNIGDLLHWDGLLAVTPTNKHVLDADTRFDLLVESAMNVCEKAVEMLLHKHKRIHVIHSEGNHDESSSVWLRRITRRTFRNNPHVTVETSPFPFYHYVWGKTFLGWHHGHLQKMEALPLVFSTDPKFKADFGGCDYAYIKTGHRHQKEVIEKGGVIVEQVETLAARDAYAARGFPYSQRGTIAVTYSKTGGEVSRVTVRPRIEGRKAA